MPPRPLARPSENEITHALDAEYVDPRPGSSPATLATLMTVPSRRGQHRRQRGVRQLHDRGDVDVELRLQHRQIGGPEFAGRAESGVVHQHPHPGGQPVGHLRAVGGVGQVGGQHLDGRAGLVVQFGGEQLQPVDVAGDQHQVVAVDGVAAGETRAQPGRRSGDQCDGAWHARQVTYR